MLDAYGSCEAGPGTERGWMLGYDFGESGEEERWWTSFAVVSAERIEHDAGKVSTEQKGFQNSSCNLP